MRAFEYLAPPSLRETQELLGQHGEEAKLLAGGTGLVILMKQLLVQPALLVSLGKVPSLKRIVRVNGALHVGAMATHRAVETSPLARELLPLLSEVYGHVATVRIREMATVGGGLAHADPTQDSPLAFLVLDGSVRLSSVRGERTMPADGFFLDHYTTVVEPDEVLTEVVVPLPEPGTGTGAAGRMPSAATPGRPELSRDSRTPCAWAMCR